MNREIRELVKISAYAGGRVDYTQGGGGNTSVKLDDNLMGIKASGYRLKDITETDGFVPVDYVEIKKYYEGVNPDDGVSHEAESVQIAKDAVRSLEGLKPLRPSVEVGFHAVLKKYVIHTHSVYANLVCCNSKGEAEAKEIFAGADFNYIFLPYITPGFTLTLVMNKAVKEQAVYPEVIFMQNHGLVVTADTLERAEKLHTEVNELIRKHYKLQKDELKSIELVEEEENLFRSETAVVRDYLTKGELSLPVLDQIPLYPDQLVYLNNTLRLSGEKMKIYNGKVYYNTTRKEAETLEETLAAYLFIVSKLKALGKDISVMSSDDVKFINNWEVEKFRRSVAK